MKEYSQGTRILKPGAIGLVDTIRDPISQVTGRKDLSATAVSEYDKATEEALFNNTGLNVDWIREKDVRRIMEQTDVLKDDPMVVLNPGFFYTLLQEGRAIPIKMSRAYGPLDSKRTGYIGKGKPLDEQCKTVHEAVEGSKGVIVGDEIASEKGNTLTFIEKKLRELNTNVSAFTTGFYHGPAFKDNGERTTLEGNIPIYSAVNSFETPEDQKKSSGREKPAIETVDLGILPEAGTTLVQGLPDHEKSILALTGMVNSVLRGKDTEGLPNINAISNALKRHGITINNPAKLMHFLKEASTDGITFHDILDLLKIIPQTHSSILKISGLDPSLNQVDERRILRIFPGSPELDHPVWNLFTIKSWEKFSDEMLVATSAFIKEMEEEYGEKISANKLPALKLPGVSRILSNHHYNGTAIGALQILRKELHVFSAHKGIDVPESKNELTSLTTDEEKLKPPDFHIIIDTLMLHDEEGKLDIQQLEDIYLRLNRSKLPFTLIGQESVAALKTHIEEVKKIHPDLKICGLPNNGKDAIIATNGSIKNYNIIPAGENIEKGWSPPTGINALFSTLYAETFPPRAVIMTNDESKIPPLAGAYVLTTDPNIKDAHVTTNTKGIPGANELLAKLGSTYKNGLTYQNDFAENEKADAIIFTK